MFDQILGGLINLLLILSLKHVHLYILLLDQLEEVIRSKDTFADPQELKIIEEKF